MQVAFLLYDRFTALDLSGPYEVLSSLPGTESVLEVPAPDIIVVPGGLGTRLFLEDEALLGWLRAAHETSTWTTSVCTGALLLAAAGLLKDAPATTHWLARETLASLGAVPVPDRVVRHGKIMTAAGVSSGIDMALRLVQAIYGDEAAQAVQLGIEYDPEPPFDAGSPERTSPPIVEAVTASFNSREAEILRAAGD